MSRSFAAIFAGFRLASVLSLGGALALSACSSATQANDEHAKCETMKSDLSACLGTTAPDLDCSALAPADVTRIQSAIDTFACSALGQGITLDGDPKSASCRMYGVGCVAAENPTPDPSATRYPILLVNGIDDSPLFRYSDRILDHLKATGATVELAVLPPWSPVAERSPVLWKRVQEVRAKTGAAKVNLVCHSLGGLDCRYVASAGGLHWDLDLPAETLSDSIASITTIATAHRGTAVADVLTGLLPDGDRASLVDAIVALEGGALASTAITRDPHVQSALIALTTSDAARFASEVPDADGVYYQSYAGYSQPFGAASADYDAAAFALCQPDEGPALAAVEHDYMALPLAPFVDTLNKGGNGSANTGLSGSGAIPVPNDGLIAVESAKWGNFRGCIPADHIEQLGQRNLPDVNVRNGFDVANFYASIAVDLAARGF